MARDSPWRALYDAFLQSPEWQAKRAAVLHRAANRCACCSTARATEVHHVVYPQAKQALTVRHFVHQPHWQLRAIGAPCHRRETVNRGTLRR